MPVHVVKGPKSSACEVPLCEDMMAIQARAGNPGFECIHLQRASQPYVRQESLHLESLREMKRQTLMTKHWRKQCTEINDLAGEKTIPTVFKISLNQESNRWIFFSVFTGTKNDNWSKFGRTIVTFDSVAGKWHCPCRTSPRSHRCVHVMLSMWQVFQQTPEILRPESEDGQHGINDLEKEILLTDADMAPPGVDVNQVIRMTEYLLSHKKIPAP